MWICPFCLSRNAFPSSYQGMHEGNVPMELSASFTTMEYALQRSTPLPPVFLFVIDTCVPDEDELDSLKSALLRGLDMLPEDCHVGLITFGRMVQIHELGFTELPKSYVFRG